MSPPAISATAASHIKSHRQSGLAVAPAVRDTEQPIAREMGRVGDHLHPSSEPGLKGAARIVRLARRGELVQQRERPAALTDLDRGLGGAEQALEPRSRSGLRRAATSNARADAASPPRRRARAATSSSAAASASSGAVAADAACQA